MRKEPAGGRRIQEVRRTELVIQTRRTLGALKCAATKASASKEGGASACPEDASWFVRA